MSTNHEVTGSDHISMLADASGFRSWKTVWDANSSLKAKRQKPNVLFHGGKGIAPDTVAIPEVKPKQESCATERSHVFRVTKEKLFLRLRILLNDFTAAKNAQYTLTVRDLPAPLTGKTDGNGQIEAEIPVQTQTAELVVRVPQPPPSDGSIAGDIPVTWHLQIGALNPIMEQAPDKWCTAGVQQRLNNLGFNSGVVDGITGPHTNGAVRAFQTMFKLNVDGKAGQIETQPKLVAVHDQPDSVLGPVPE